MGTAQEIDALMEEASQALIATAYFQVERLCIEAMMLARRAYDLERMARIMLPLQEARRQRRHMALDSGFGVVISKLPRDEFDCRPGCYLLRPPLIAADAREIREAAFEREVPVVIMTREPRTSAGKWPVVAVTSDRSYRVQLPVPRVNDVEIADDAAPDSGWFMAAIEAVGDAAIARLKPTDPALFRVEDLWDAMQALPEHEKMAQRFAQECIKAKKEPRPEKPRRRGVFEDLSTF